MHLQIEFYAGGTTFQVTLIPPSECPICLRSIVPISRSHHARAVNQTPSNFTGQVDAVFLCPNPTCSRLFIACYESVERINVGQGMQPIFRLTHVLPKTFQPTIFDETIGSLSAQFEQLYNQSAYAEQMGLDEICGLGYRKALEFLVKDYAIASRPESTEKIKSTPLGTVIQEYLSDASKVKEIAQRAVWLGNDETHYVRKWENKDIHDLKELIKLTVHWIASDLISQQLLAEMPSRTP